MSGTLDIPPFDPTAPSTVVDIPPFDPTKPSQVVGERLRLTPQQMLRDVARGIIGTPVDVYSLVGYLSGSDRIREQAQAANTYLDENITPKVEFSQDPWRAGLQMAAPALVPLPATGLAGALTSGAARAGAGATTQGVVAGATRLAEAALPGTAGFTTRNVALNAGAGVGIGAGVEALQDKAERDRAAMAANVQPLADGEVPPPFDPNAPSSVPVTSATAASDALPWIVGSIAVLSAAAAARYAARAGRQADAANVGGNIQPGTAPGAGIDPALGERFEAGVFNNNQVLLNRLDEAARTGRITRAEADDAANLLLLQTREAINNDITTEAMRTGDWGYGIRTEAPTRIMDDIAQLTPQQRRVFNDLMSAADEWDVRQQNIREGKWHQGQPGTAQRNALSDIDDATLRRQIAAGRSDQAIAQLETRYRAINNGLLDLAVRRGVFSPREAADMRAKGPNYMHRLMSEEIVQRNQGAGMPLTSGVENNSPMALRDRGVDTGPMRYQDPMVSLEDGVRQTIDFINRNEAIRAVAKALGNGTATGIGRAMRAGPKVQVAKGYVPVKFRDNGVRMVLEMEPTMAAAVMPYPRAFIPVLNGTRILAQNVTTGPLGALFGNIQAPLSAMMGSQAALINTPSALRVGWLDQAIRRVTGANLRKAGFVDPTFYAQAVYEAVPQVAAFSAQVFADSANRMIARNSYLAQVIGASRLQSMADAAAQAYERSLLHEMRRIGMLAQGVSYGANERAIGRNIANLSPDYARTMPYGGRVPSMFDVRSVRDFEEWFAKESNRALPGVMRNGWNNYARFLDMISNLPQAAIYRQNRAQFAGREKTLAGIARTAVGDPAQYGGFKAVQMGTSAIMYQNIAMQAAHQVFSAIRREPVAASARLGVLTGMTALAVLSSAIMADEDAIRNGEEPRNVAHMMTQNSREAVSSFRFYLPGVDPNNTIRLPIEGALSPAYFAAMAALEQAFDVANPRFYTAEYAPLREAITRMMGDNDVSRLRASIGRAGADLAMPPVIAGAMGVAGYNTRDALALGSGPRMPEIMDADGLSRDRILRDPVNRYVATVMETSFGLGGQAALDLARTYGYTGSLRATAQQAGQNTTGAGRLAPFLTGPERRQGTYDAVGEAVKRNEAVMENVNRNMSEVLLGPGTMGPLTRPSRSAVEGGREGVPPDMVPVLATINAAHNSMRVFRQERSEFQRQLRDVEASAQMRADPAAMRARQNELSLQVRSINNRIYERMAQLETQLSVQTGRRVSLADLDATKGLDQFPPLR